MKTITTILYYGFWLFLIYVSLDTIQMPLWQSIIAFFISLYFVSWMYSAFFLDIFFQKD